MFLYEGFALFVGLGPIKLEEAVVACGFGLGTSTTTGIFRDKHFFFSLVR